MFRTKQILEVSPTQPTLILFLIAVFYLVSIFGNPFIYDGVNSGRQLAAALKTIDRELFANDPVVDTFTHFRSLFYDGLSALVRFLSLGAPRLELTLFLLYLVARLLTLIALFFIAKALDKSIWLFILLAAWSCHPKSVPVGGPGGGAWIFQPLLTHNDVALIILLFVLYHLFGNNYFTFWALTGLALFVHSLYALHLTLCITPLLFHPGRLNKNFWFGLVAFGICCIIYLAFYAPSDMGLVDGKIFLSVEGDSGHISLFNQKPTLWIRMLLVGSVSVLAHYNFTRDNNICRWLVKFACSGFAFGIFLSAMAMCTHSVKLSLFQPMRIFIWVTLFFHLLLGIATIKAFGSSLEFGLILAAILLLTAIYSSRSDIAMFTGVIFLTARLAVLSKSLVHLRKIEKCLGVLLASASALLIGALSIGGLLSIQSLYKPLLFLPAIFCLLLLLIGKKTTKLKTATAVLAIGLALLIASFDRYAFYKKAANEDWTKIRRWCQVNTAKTDRFITPPEDNSFRSLSLRTTVSERNIEVVWSDPQVYLDNKANADLASVGYRKDYCDVNYLFELARKWDCKFIVSKGGVMTQKTPVYQSGAYKVYKTDDDFSGVNRN